MSARSDLPRLTLVLGGARSGKSAFAESLVESASRPLYVATAEATDAEMAARIEAHRRRRGARWETVEESLALADVIEGLAAPGTALLVDCITVWLGNLLHHERDLDAEIGALLESLAAARGPVVCVANEVGWSIVPDNPLARAFRDRAGQLNQALAARAEEVHLVVAGLATRLKGATVAGRPLED